MSAAAFNSPLVRFGPFEIDPNRGVLHRHGVPLPLQQRSVHVLAILLASPGEWVTRESIRQQLTLADNDVEEAIREVCDALGDSAENPHFVEALPRRGYRFIGSLEPHAPSGPVLVRDENSASDPAIPGPMDSPPAVDFGQTIRMPSAEFAKIVETITKPPEPAAKTPAEKRKSFWRWSR